MTQVEKIIEDKAREIYLFNYGKIGGRWELVADKQVWRRKAREVMASDEGTRMVRD